jgi:predicted Na+-dependent transporter
MSKMVKTSALLVQARNIRKHYSALIVTSMIIGLTTGLITNAPGLFIKTYSSLIIAIMIWAMSFAIRPRDLLGALKNVKSYSAGLALNFLLAPVICWILAILFLQELPEAAVGLMLVGVTPCAGMAMVWTGMLDGDLSIALLINAGTMLLAPFLMPLLMYIMAGSLVIIDMARMFQDLAFTVLIPVVLGILSRWLADRRLPKKAGRASEYTVVFSAIAALMAMILMFMVMQTSVQMILSNPATVPPIIVSVALVFPILFVLVWYGTAASFERPVRVALAYSSGMKNLPLALGVSITSFGGLAPLPVAVGFVFQMVTAVIMYKWLSSRLSHTDGATSEAKA